MIPFYNRNHIGIMHTIVTIVIELIRILIFGLNDEYDRTSSQGS
jgi:hypothetical protein